VPSWAWAMRGDAEAPAPVVVHDGWYLVTDDPGPKLLLAGPLRSQQQCVDALPPAAAATGALRLRAVLLHRGVPAQGARCGPARLARGGVTHLLPPPPLPRTNWTRLVPPLVLSGHAASLTPY